MIAKGRLLLGTLALVIALVATDVVTLHLVSNFDAYLAIIVGTGLVCAVGYRSLRRWLCPQCGRIKWQKALAVRGSRCESCGNTDDPGTSQKNLRDYVTSAIVWISASIAVGGFCLAAPWVSWQPTTEVLNVTGTGVGGPDSCYRKDLEQVPNGSGSVAGVRAVYCPGQNVLDIGYEFFAVFVHRTHERSSEQNLVLLFIPDDPAVSASSSTRSPRQTPVASWFGESAPPKVKWIGSRALQITTKCPVTQLLVQKADLHGFSVNYDFADGQPQFMSPQLRSDRTIQ
jgi:hypothetical protein